MWGLNKKCGRFFFVFVCVFCGVLEVFAVAEYDTRSNCFEVKCPLIFEVIAHSLRSRRCVSLSTCTSPHERKVSFVPEEKHRAHRLAISVLSILDDLHGTYLSLAEFCSQRENAISTPILVESNQTDGFFFYSLHNRMYGDTPGFCDYLVRVARSSSIFSFSRVL